MDAERLLVPGVQVGGENELRLLIYANEITRVFSSQADREYAPVLALEVTPVERAFLCAPVLPKPYRVYIGTEHIFKDRWGTNRDRATRRIARIVHILYLHVEGDLADAKVATWLSPMGGLGLHYKLAKSGGKWRIIEFRVTSAT